MFMTDRVTWTDIMLTPGAHVSRFCHAAPPSVSLSRAESVSVLILWSYTKNICDWQTKWMFSLHCCPLVVSGCSVYYRASQYSVTSDEGVVTAAACKSSQIILLSVGPGPRLQCLLLQHDHTFLPERSNHTALSTSLHTWDILTRVSVSTCDQTSLPCSTCK